jgi:hypothetical protein
MAFPQVQNVDASGAVIGQPLQAGGNVGLNVGTPLVQTSIGSAAAVNVVTLPTAAGRTTYISGFELTTGIVLAGVSTVVAVAGISNGLNYQVTELALGNGNLIVSYIPAIPASAANTVITVSLPALTGGGVTALNARGYLI